MTSHDYLVEMSFAPFPTLPSPPELITFSERFVQPTLDACQRLMAEGRILAGGTALGAVGFHFIARASSAQEFEDMLTSLPLWPRAQTRIVPLGTFENRARLTSNRLHQIKSLVPPALPEPARTA